LASFKSLANLKTAGRDEIAAVPGITDADADRVYLYFHSKPNQERKG
ncbi:MAG: hypothetical protein II557_01930, partial [Clostridia bacterium]|nr:hypothetical protein [Clostridia bacterium]